MDTELLRTFLEVRNTRHFGRAAENLFISAAAVSARIKQLEELLGVTLFVRERNNIQLSAEGERLVPHAETVLLAWSRARQELVATAREGSQLSLCVRIGLWGPALQARLHRLQRELPAVTCRLETQPGEIIMRRLLDRTVDLGLVYEAPAIPELRTRVVGRLELRLFAAGRAVDIPAALAERYLYVDWGEGFARFHAKHYGERVVPTLRTNISALAADYLRSSGGAAFLPVSMGPTLARDGVYPVDGAAGFARDIHLVYRPGSPAEASLGEWLSVLADLEI